jgi:hypothetical protein
MKKIDYTPPEISKKAQEFIARDKKIMFGAHTRTRSILFSILVRDLPLWAQDIVIQISLRQ